MWLFSLISGAIGFISIMLRLTRDKRLMDAGQADLTIAILEKARSNVQIAREAARLASRDPAYRKFLRGKYKANN